MTGRCTTGMAPTSGGATSVTTQVPSICHTSDHRYREFRETQGSRPVTLLLAPQLSAHSQEPTGVAQRSLTADAGGCSYQVMWSSGVAARASARVSEPVVVRVDPSPKSDTLVAASPIRATRPRDQAGRDLADGVEVRSAAARRRSSRSGRCYWPP